MDNKKILEFALTIIMQVATWFLILYYIRYWSDYFTPYMGMLGTLFFIPILISIFVVFVVNLIARFLGYNFSRKRLHIVTAITSIMPSVYFLLAVEYSEKF